MMATGCGATQHGALSAAAPSRDQAPGSATRRPGPTRPGPTRPGPRFRGRRHLARGGAMMHGGDESMMHGGDELMMHGGDELY